MELSKIVGINDPEADVGIEIEVEGRGLIPYESPIWTAKPDGSLRDGIEYVFRSPLGIERVEESLDELSKALAKAELSFSFRTSVHVHVNCLGMDYDQVLNYIYISTLMDTILVHYCGEQRKTNRFCLRLSDAEGLIDGIAPLFRFRNRPDAPLHHYIQRNYIRYAAINVESLAKFGTIEFRSMRGTLDKQILIPWAEVLVQLREFSKKFKDPLEMYENITKKGAMSVIKEVLGKHYDLFAYEGMEQDFNLNMSLSIELPFTPSQKGEDFREYDIARSRFTSIQVREILPPTPNWAHLKRLLEQGVLSDPHLSGYFIWEEYIEYLLDYQELPGVVDLLEDLGVEF